MSNTVSESKQICDGANRVETLENGASSFDSSAYKSSADDSVRNKDPRGSFLYSGSDEYFSCDPCSSAGDHLEAHGYCTKCEEYLCDTCFRSHSRSKVSKSHALLIKDAMPKKSQISLKQCDPCKTAGEDREFVGYCTDCEEYLCSSCYISHSKSKLSRQHMLIDKDSFSAEDFDQAVTDSLAALSIDTIDTGACNEKYIFLRNINVKADTDKNDCFISRMTLISNTKLVLCDIDNICLKLVDIESCSISEVLILQAKPTGITKISDQQVAVLTDKEYEIEIISIYGGLTLDRTIKTNGICMDIKFTNGKFYAACWGPVKFQILQSTGSIVKTIKPDLEFLKHISAPLKIAISPDESIIYVSDSYTNSVLSMDMNGNMIAMYLGELEEPHDITVSPGGAVYLCNRKQEVVYKMTSDLKEATMILGPGDGLVFPCAICLNIEKQNLFISSASPEAEFCNSIKKYEWK